ncbi:MAG: hypothetical protein ACRD2H_12285 [Terriglobales bacterium]
MLDEVAACTPEAYSIAGRIADCLGTPPPNPPAPLTDAEWQAATRAEPRLRATDPEAADALVQYVVDAVLDQAYYQVVEPAFERFLAVLDQPAADLPQVIDP